MDFTQRQIIVTGGTGALGSAVVGALLDAGARCRIPVFNDAELAHFPHTARVELVPHVDLANEVAPSTIDTPANRASMPQADHASWPSPAQIAATIAFLASPQNEVTSGAIVPVYGRA